MTLEQKRHDYLKRAIHYYLLQNPEGLRAVDIYGCLDQKYGFTEDDVFSVVTSEWSAGNIVIKHEYERSDIYQTLATVAPLPVYIEKETPAEVPVRNTEKARRAGFVPLLLRRAFYGGLGLTGGTGLLGLVAVPFIVGGYLVQVADSSWSLADRFSGTPVRVEIVTSNLPSLLSGVVEASEEFTDGVVSSLSPTGNQEAPNPRAASGNTSSKAKDTIGGQASSPRMTGQSDGRGANQQPARSGTSPTVRTSRGGSDTMRSAQSTERESDSGGREQRTCSSSGVDQQRAGTSEGTSTKGERGPAHQQRKQVGADERAAREDGPPARARQAPSGREGPYESPPRQMHPPPLRMRLRFGAPGR